eukprot:CAMPEP_0205918304 /NCGR_PEP_ID=MMETSP1325-20131115/9711_1 /ASSEMBLY_ACC=CAM_ASM_000708 /TAXON_ID=236786 /ORGANISM="Florenciella sp., Strain RCC1007" /LENGTH=81 /DNA_ID=CAMNT_0053285815 /DNA_START=143 /DNA_END=388 /DNA_ORIENTATION=-
MRLRAEVGQIEGHQWAPTHLLDDVTNVPECVPNEDVVVIHSVFNISGLRDAALANHKDLSQRPGGALAQLVFSGHDDVVVQ